MNKLVIITNFLGAIALLSIIGCIIVWLIIILLEKLEEYNEKKFRNIKHGIVREIGVEIISYAYWFSHYKEVYPFMVAFGEYLRDRGFNPSGDELRKKLIDKLKESETQNEKIQ